MGIGGGIVVAPGEYGGATNGLLVDIMLVVVCGKVHICGGGGAGGGCVRVGGVAVKGEGVHSARTGRDEGTEPPFFT